MRPSRAGQFRVQESYRARQAAARSGASPWALDPRAEEGGAPGRMKNEHRRTRNEGDGALTWRFTARPFPVLIITPETVRDAFRIKPAAVELRADLFHWAPERLIKLMNDLHPFASVLLTLRRQVDGGSWESKREGFRRAQMLALAPHADAVDVELDLAEDELGRAFLRHVKRALKPGKVILASQHDCRGLPRRESLETFLTLASYVKPARFKLAATVKTNEQAKSLCAWAFEKHTVDLPITAIAMGPAGTWTRWFLPKKLGGPAYAPAGRSVAPGQVPYAKMAALLKSRD